MSDPDAFTTMPMPGSEPAEPSDFLDRVRLHGGATSARAFEVFRGAEP
ncbi:hypothetical protein [Amnibacterium endophyticum]|uniref:Uncharacterized protein n=1 Tax=Amnibacterium endophyticum TaxID=2109337 RepID=A0ABW4LH45_9MICO